MDRRTIGVALVMIIASTAVVAAADKTSFGLGVGALYSGLGGNIALIKADDMKFLSIGCSEMSRSSIDGTDLTCGLGIGWIRSDIITKRNSKHGLGLNIAVDYDQRYSEIEPAIRIPYVFFLASVHFLSKCLFSSPPLVECPVRSC